MYGSLMKKEIPQPIISVASEFISYKETHASLDNLFGYADAPGEPPDGSKPTKATAWLRRINKESTRPLEVFGKLIENYMESDSNPDSYDAEEKATAAFVIKMNDMLSKYSLRYITGGHITDGSSLASLSLQEAIKELNFPAVDMEFTRALENVEKEPREAVSAACNILESTFKIFIADENLPAPSKQDLQGLWKVVRDKLGMDTKTVEDDDLRKILSGLYTLTEGIGALRTHASSAHGAGRKIYNLKPRHARLAIHSAHTLVLYILESWMDMKSRS